MSNCSGARRSPALMTGLAFGIGLGLFGQVASAAEGSPASAVQGVFQRYCIANKAIAADVTAAAQRDGWAKAATPAKNGGDWWGKTIDGQRVWLHARADPDSAADGALDQACLVRGAGDYRAAIAEIARIAGGAPVEEKPDETTFAFLERADGQHTALSMDQLMQSNSMPKSELRQLRIIGGKSADGELILQYMAVTAD